MKKLIITLIIFTFFTSSTFAQTLKTQIEQIDSVIGVNGQKLADISTPIQTNSFESESYVDPDWKHGVILTIDDELIHISGRINIETGYLECKYENRIRAVRSSSVQLVHLDGKIFMPVSGSTMNPQRTNTYMRILSIGRINLLEYYYIDLRKAGGGNLLTEKITGTTEMRLLTDLYYTKTFDTIRRLRTNKKYVLAVLGNDKRVENHIEVNDLKFSSYRDISIMFDFYNSID